MTDWVVYNYRVILPCAHPVRANPGDIIRVRPGHPTAPVAVWRRQRGEWTRIRVGPPNYGGLIIQEYNGVISRPEASEAQHSDMGAA